MGQLRYKLCLQLNAPLQILFTRSLSCYIYVHAVSYINTAAKACASHFIVNFV